MLTGRHPSRPQGFALWELAAAIAVVAILAAMAAVSLSESRRQASLGDNFANLKQFAIGTSAYAADNDDRTWAFSWEAGVQYVPNIPPAGSQIEAAAFQAVHIIRTRSEQPYFPHIVGWFPHLRYSHLVLLDYLESRLPQRFVAAPEDHLRLLWQADPINIYPYLPPHQRPGGPASERWPYSSSYELPPAFYSQDASGPNGTTVSQDAGFSQHTYWTGTLPLGGRRLSEIAFPSQKVMLYEDHQRHFGPRFVYFMYTEARVPLLLSDGSAALRRTADANRGFHPSNPTSLTMPTRVTYQPAIWEAPPLNGASEELVTAHYRFTRSGLRGRDFDGPEVPWVP